MRHAFVFPVCLLLATAVSACTPEEPGGDELIDQLRAASSGPFVVRNRGGLARSIRGAIAPPSSVGTDPRAVAEWFVEEYGNLWGIADPTRDVAFVRVQSKTTGGGAVVFRRWIGDYLILGSELRIHVDVDGVITSVTAALPVPGDIPLIERLAEEDAALLASRAIGGAAPWGIRLIGYNEGLWKGGRSSTVAAYEVLLQDEEGDHHVLLDAAGGEMLLIWSDINDALERVTYDAQGQSVKGSWDRAVEALRDDTPNPAATEEAQRAHALAKETYDWYFERFGRDGLDDAGVPLLTYVDVGGGGAWMSKRQDETQPRLGFSVGYVAKDVFVHEFTHAVIAFTSNLKYRGQSGALNESFADVFSMLATPEEGENRYLIGETTTRGALRSFRDPPSLPIGGGVPADIMYPKHFIDFHRDLGFDSGGVHINSSIPNYAAYLVLVGGEGVAAVPQDRMDWIYYTAMTEHLVETSRFVDAREALQTAAWELQAKGAHGVTLSDCKSVLDAWAAVGLGAPDADGDCWDDDEDNCPDVSNPEQRPEEACREAATIPKWTRIACPMGLVQHAEVCTVDCETLAACGECIAEPYCAFCALEGRCLWADEADESTRGSCGLLSDTSCLPDCADRSGCAGCTTGPRVGVEGRYVGCAYCPSTDTCVADFDPIASALGCEPRTNDALECPDPGCGDASSCAECLGRSGCRYCPSNGRCVPPNAPNGWLGDACGSGLDELVDGDFNICPRESCSGTVCVECEDGCGFCQDTGRCEPGRSGGSPVSSCAVWSADVFACGDACASAAAPCLSTGDCCNTSVLECYGSVCTDILACPGGSSLLGEDCDASVVDSCCTNLTCGRAAMGGDVCCMVDGSNCASDDDCCGEMTCISDSCTCRATGESCLSGRECCGGSFCDGGFCT